MDSRVAGSSGLLGSVRGLADGLLGSLHDRAELLAIELHEEKNRLIQTFIWISSIVFLAMLAVIFASLMVVVIFWQTARVEVVTSLTLLYVGAFAAVVMGFRRYLKRQPRPFAATRQELQLDRECTRAAN